MTFGATRGYRSLLAWQKAMDLADRVYDVTDSWPDRERFGLCSQSRRAAVSIASNIAEGQGRNSAGDFARFLDIAYVSLCELETQHLLAGRRQMMTGSKLERLMADADEVARLTRGLAKSVRSRSSIQEAESEYDSIRVGDLSPQTLDFG